MNRIVVSPKVCAVAAHLLGQHTATGEHRLDVVDRDLADTLGLEPDTIYRAIVELHEHGALHHGGLNRATGARSVLIIPRHWVFLAVAATGAKVAQ